MPRTKPIIGRKRNAHVRPKSKEHLRVKIGTIDGKIILCSLPLEKTIKVGYGRQKSGISKQKYKLALPSRRLQTWGKIEGIDEFSDPDGIVNASIVIKNRGKIVKGTILSAAIVSAGGGATSPPASGGLPPVDE